MEHPLLARRRPLIGVVHLPPLAGPRAPGVEAVLERAGRDAQAYAEAGFDAVLVENFSDTPFPKERSAPHVVALMARAVAAACQAGLPTGVNVLRNDVLGALAACHAGGGMFVRANVLAGAQLTDQGLIEGRAHEVMSYRALLGRATGGDRIAVCADVAVKHAAPLVPRPIEDEAHDLVHRAQADVVLVTGAATGRPAAVEDLRRAKAGAGAAPVWAASGVDANNVRDILDVADGVVVGSAAKVDGATQAPVDRARAAAIVQAARH